MRISTILATVVLGAAMGCGPGGDSDALDQDGDGISDSDEGRSAGLDTDGDGTPDYVDADSDGDGFADALEAGDALLDTPPVDSDNDGTPDFQDLDSDDNTLLDNTATDSTDDLDGDGLGNWRDLDDDGDELSDAIEVGPTPGMPVDSDGDGAFDFQDLDSDGDGIGDVFEWNGDPDNDGVPSYLDDDSDGDCIPDSLEGGVNDPTATPLDSDGDGLYNFLDQDSDADGLLDAVEDENCNGAADTGESSATDQDTDGDGVSDLVEDAAGTDPTDALDNPQANGDFVFIVPYMDAHSPDDDTLDFATDISQADIVFAMDTTGSMGQEITNLKASVSSLVASVQADIPNAAFGLVSYEDFPTSPYGNVGDYPHRLHHRIMTAGTMAGLTSIQNQVNGLTAANGGDGPESGFEMLYQVATGGGTTEGGANVAPFDAAGAFPATPPPGETTGTLGGVGFRVGSLPIVVWMTDACSHNNGVSAPYSGIAAATAATSTAQLVGMSSKVIAVVSDPTVTGGCGASTAEAEATGVITATDSIVPPSAWGPVGVRPTGCALAQCCTGISGIGQATDGNGECPLMFRINGNTGTGLGTSVGKAIEVLANFSTLDISSQAVDDPSDAVDAVAAFVDKVVANPAAGAPCTQGLTAVDTNSDGALDTFSDVLPANRVCFDVLPKDNTTVPPTASPQMFEATVEVLGDGVTALDERRVFFLVPPSDPDIID